MPNSSFTILITTKNRKTDLVLTLNKIGYLLEDFSVSCTVFDDGSIDGTFEYIKENFPTIQLHRNETSQGYLFCRNKMLNDTKADYAISLDDDAHFATENPLESIRNHFEENTRCGLVALRIFWGLKEPKILASTEETERVQGFVGCGHVWRMNAWRNIPNYPAWFVFYGEEDFAGYHLFIRKWEIHYLPEVLVHHRVDVKARRNNADYTIRLRWSLRSGWFLFFLFYPLKTIPRKMGYSIWIQLKLKVFKGECKVLQSLFLASMELICSIPKILRNRYPLTQEEYDEYQKLPATKIYWQPENN
jgi:glycosyltransferase involved in cell wall biosynthesis